MPRPPAHDAVVVLVGRVPPTEPAHSSLRNLPSNRAIDTARWMLLDIRTAKVFRDLSAAGITAIVLKGPSTVARLYPNETRPYADVDLLVGPDERDRTRETLMELGFQMDPSLRVDRPQ